MFKTATPSEARRLLDEGYTYVDVRSEGEYAAGHPHGARNVPVMHAGAMGMRPNPDFLDEMRRSFPTDARLVIGCKSGGRSARACEMLEAAGYTEVVNMDGGFHGRYDAMGRLAQAGWEQEGHPTKAGADDSGPAER